MEQNRENIQQPCRFLLMIDCQNDFILEDSPMCVSDARAKMEALEEYLNLDYDSQLYRGVVETADFHLKNHCSFKEQGGPWPSHCIANTTGAESFIKKVPGTITDGEVIIVHKGVNQNKEEYGADAENVITALMASAHLQHPSQVYEAAEIDVVGIMSEYCVLETVQNLVSYIKQHVPQDTTPTKIRLLLPFISTADNHKKLLDFAAENKDIVKVVLK